MISKKESNISRKPVDTLANELSSSLLDNSTLLELETLLHTCHEEEESSDVEGSEDDLNKQLDKVIS